MERFRDRMLYIGLGLFSIISCLEHSGLFMNDLGCFFRGMSCSFIIIGMFVLYQNKKTTYEQ